MIARSRKNRIEYLFDILFWADYDKPWICHWPEMKKYALELKRKGLIENNPGTDEWRRTEKGDNFLLGLFPTKKVKKVKK